MRTLSAAKDGYYLPKGTEILTLLSPLKTTQAWCLLMQIIKIKASRSTIWDLFFTLSQRRTWKGEWGVAALLDSPNAGPACSLSGGQACTGLSGSLIWDFQELRTHRSPSIESLSLAPIPPHSHSGPLLLSLHIFNLKFTSSRNIISSRRSSLTPCFKSSCYGVF